jgi:hypothetical protein
MALWLWINTAQAAAPVAGFEWAPLGRGDLTWVEEQRTSTFAVGELDGFSRPSLSFYAGAWTGPRVQLTGSLGMARLQSTTVIDGVYRQRFWGVARPGFDGRWLFADPDDRWPIPFLLTGLYASVPTARDLSNGYTKEEQGVADAQAESERARLGGFGARAGFGAELRLGRGVTLGGQYALAVHRAVFQADDANATTAWIRGEANFLLGFLWPDPSSRREASGDGADR